jgi:hypothetical protein
MVQEAVFTRYSCTAARVSINLIFYVCVIVIMYHDVYHLFTCRSLITLPSTSNATPIQRAHSTHGMVQT